MPEELKTHHRFSPDEIVEIRRMRAERHPDSGKKIWTHAALAEKFGTTPGTISHIVRNLTYYDADYNPIND